MENTLIIVPTYNEIENIESLIEAVLKNDWPLDLLVVDDQSPDGTAAAVIRKMKNFPKRLFLESRANKKGLGTAYVHGFKWALRREYQYVFEMDADFSHDPKELMPMLELLEQGTDLVIGSRYVKRLNTAVAAKIVFC